MHSLRSSKRWSWRPAGSPGMGSTTFLNVASFSSSVMLWLRWIFSCRAACSGAFLVEELCRCGVPPPQGRRQIGCATTTPDRATKLPWYSNVVCPNPTQRRVPAHNRWGRTAPQCGVATYIAKRGIPLAPSCRNTHRAAGCAAMRGAYEPPQNNSTTRPLLRRLVGSGSVICYDCALVATGARNRWARGRFDAAEVGVGNDDHHEEGERGGEGGEGERTRRRRRRREKQEKKQEQQREQEKDNQQQQQQKQKTTASRRCAHLHARARGRYGVHHPRAQRLEEPVGEVRARGRAWR